MKKFHFLIHPIVIFVLFQLAWLSLLGIWIYWYVTNYIIFNTVGDKLSPQLISKATNISALVLGLVLLVAILVGMSLIFIYLTRQLNITRLYDNFIANITHELKSPLASIQLYLETLSTRDIPREKQHEFLALMLKDANRLKRLINSILELGIIEQKTIAHNYHVYETESIVRELICESKDQFKLSNEAIRIEGTASCQCVLDRNAMKIVIDNLVDNAIKYNVNPVKISINLSVTNKNNILHFKDNGIGMSLKNQKKIFNKFQRIYDQHSPNVKGTGLGLYWVRQIIKYHGGKISVFSEGLDMGSTFKIELPIYQATKKRYINYLLKLTKKSHRENEQSESDDL